MTHMKKITNGILILLFGSFMFFGCQSEDTIINPTNNGSATDEEALSKIIESDEQILSFEPNYNEEDAMDIGLAKVNTEIFPVRVGQRMTLVDMNVEYEFDADSAIGTITKYFDGVLRIAASYEEWEPGDTAVVDTIIEKEFSTVMTRKVIFQKIGNSIFPDSNWVIKALSLPAGGTTASGVEITKVTVEMPDGEFLEITEPNEYYLYRRPGYRNQVPVIPRFRDVNVQVEVTSAYADSDFVSLTYGAMFAHNNRRAKKLFHLVSEEFDGTVYNRVYETTWRTAQWPGFKHAIINVLPYQAIKELEGGVEENTWGIPYIVL